MGYWQCKDGTKVEMIFNEQGDFIKFGDDVTEENAEKAKEEIMLEQDKVRNQFKLGEMLDKDIPVEEIAEKLGECDCVERYGMDIPSTCHEDADCLDCWVKCLENRLKQ